MARGTLVGRVVEAAGPEQLAALVAKCAASRTPIIDYGVAHGGVGNPPPAEHVRLVQRVPESSPGDSADTEVSRGSGGSGGAVGGVIEHYDLDLAVRASAAATLGQLRAALWPTGQFLPIDADDDLTLGEVINHHVYGAFRAGYGSIRDLLLGLRFVDGRGDDIRVGGRTVKNVAGYDVTRLMVGSLGELGLIHEATLRTYAVPEQALAAELEVGDLRALDAAQTRWLTSDAAPAAMVLSNAAGRWIARVAYVGRPTATAAQLRALETLAAQVEDMRLAGHTAATLEQELAELAQRRRWRREAAALMKLVVPPARTGAACEAMAEALGRDAAAAEALTVDALPVHGCLFIGGALDENAARALDAAAARAITDHGGFRVWHARAAGAEALAPFAPMPPETPIMLRLKHALDPDFLFNPGRLLPLEGRAP